VNSFPSAMVVVGGRLRENRLVASIADLQRLSARADTSDPSREPQEAAPLTAVPPEPSSRRQT
jgi:hypothetical protein